MQYGTVFHLTHMELLSHPGKEKFYLTGYLPMSQKVGETQNRQFSRNLCHSTLSWSKLTTQNIFDL